MKPVWNHKLEVYSSGEKSPQKKDNINMILRWLTVLSPVLCRTPCLQQQESSEAAEGKEEMQHLELDSSPAGLPHYQGQVGAPGFSFWQDTCLSAPRYSEPLHHCLPWNH